MVLQCDFSTTFLATTLHVLKLMDFLEDGNKLKCKERANSYGDLLVAVAVWQQGAVYYFWNTYDNTEKLIGAAVDQDQSWCFVELKSWKPRVTTLMGTLEILCLRADLWIHWSWHALINFSSLILLVTTRVGIQKVKHTCNMLTIVKFSSE